MNKTRRNCKFGIEFHYISSPLPSLPPPLPLSSNPQLSTLPPFFLSPLPPRPTRRPPARPAPPLPPLPSPPFQKKIQIPTPTLAALRLFLAIPGVEAGPEAEAEAETEAEVKAMAAASRGLRRRTT